MYTEKLVSVLEIVLLLLFRFDLLQNSTENVLFDLLLGST